MGVVDNAQSGSNIPSNSTAGLEGFWTGFLVATAIFILIIIIFFCAYLYNKKQRNNLKTNIHKEEFELLERYRKLNDTEKNKIIDIISSTNENISQNDNHKKE